MTEQAAVGCSRGPNYKPLLTGICETAMIKNVRNLVLRK